jgi:hypothetical protein
MLRQKDIYLGLSRARVFTADPCYSYQIYQLWTSPGVQLLLLLLTAYGSCLMIAVYCG